MNGSYCENCDYWHALKEDNKAWGICTMHDRKNAPVFLQVRGDNPIIVMETAALFYCSEWRENLDKPVVDPASEATK